MQRHRVIIVVGKNFSLRKESTPKQHIQIDDGDPKLKLEGRS